jgi:hypothetical protein
MSKLHILMPFFRTENKGFYDTRFSFLNLLWHPIVVDVGIFVESDIIKPLILDIKNKPENDQTNYWKLNEFIKSSAIDDNDYYWVINDDDYFSEHIPFSLSYCVSDVVFVSMMRGQCIPDDPRLDAICCHPSYTLYAIPESVMPCQIGCEQFIIKGKVLKTLKFDQNNPYSDGYTAVNLKNNFQCEYRRDWFVFFNWLQKGRWVK